MKGFPKIVRGMLSLAEENIQYSMLNIQFSIETPNGRFYLNIEN